MNMHVFDVLENYFKRKSGAPLMAKKDKGKKDIQHPGAEEMAQWLSGLVALLQRTKVWFLEPATLG